MNVGKEMCWIGRREDRERAETRKDFGVLMVVSCGDNIRGRWRTKLDLSSGKSFDDQHRATALRANPKIAGAGGGDLLVGLRCGAEQLETKWQGGGTFTIG